jgi:hypothetical protein
MMDGLIQTNMLYKCVLSVEIAELVGPVVCQSKVGDPYAGQWNGTCSPTGSTSGDENFEVAKLGLCVRANKVMVTSDEGFVERI